MIEQVYQGYLMDTRNTRRWTKEERFHGNYAEQCRLFKNQSSRDDGKSRILVSVFSTPEDAFMAMNEYNNALEKLKEIQKRIFNV